jgi:hypothetical protein
MEQKIKETKTVLFHWEAEGTSYCPGKKKNGILEMEFRLNFCWRSNGVPHSQRRWQFILTR